MKSSNASTTRVVRWFALAGLLLAFADGSCIASAQRLVSFGHTDQQKPSASDSTATADLPVMTPEIDADLMVAHQHYDAAISAYKKISPRTADLYNKIGIAYQHLSLFPEARYNYDQAMKMDRKYAPAYNNLGTLDFHDKDNKHAERLYRKSIKLSPQTAAFWSNLGAAYLADKKYRDGAEAYQRAFVLDTDIFQEIAMNGFREFTSSADMAQMYICFAGIYAQAGLKAEAVDYLRKALLEDFHDRQSLQQDQQFATLHSDPAFQQLFANQRK